MKKFCIFLAVLISLPLFGQEAPGPRTGVREEVQADWNKASGLESVYDMTRKQLSPAPKGYTPIYISHYGRHGSRYAYTDRAYKIILTLLQEGKAKDNLTERGQAMLEQLEPFWNKARYQVGELTPLGWQQHAWIAKDMIHTFPSVFRKGSVVEARSSAAVRAVVSMASFVASVSREAPKAQVYAHQGTLDAPATRPNLGENPFRYKGPEYVFPYPESSEKFFLRRFPQYETVLARLFKDPGKAVSAKDAYNVLFHLYMAVGSMNNTPVKYRTDGIFTAEEYATMWEIDNYDRFREYSKYQTSCSSIIDDIVAKADSRLESGVRGADLRFGHDHVVMTLLMLMDIDGFATVPEKADDLAYWFQSFRSPMAANIQLVFYAPKCKKDKDILVKVLLNGEEVRLGSLETQSGPYYRWDTLKPYLLERTVPFVTEKPAMPE